MSTQLVSPVIFAAAAAILAALVILYGLAKRYRWLRAAAELRDVSRILDTTHGTHGHRDLYHSFEHISNALIELGKRRPAARWVLDELRPVVAQYHRRSVVGSAGAWDEIRDSFLERKRHPVRVTRAAAGWVVLLGLAGTVLGFMEALPALREVLASQADKVEAASPPSGETAPDAGNGTAADAETPDAAAQAALTGQKLNRVLDSLRGVFLATFWGVISAFVLSACSLLLLEPAFDRFADDVDVLGARWFEPLILPPDTLIDDALRGELRSYFDEIGKRLETVLDPLISQLRVSLQQMSGLASDFSSNIRMGVGTLEAFHGAVKELGGSAQGAVDQLVKIVRTSGDFVREVESLQQKGLDKLAEALSGPTGVLADSAAAMDARVQGLEGQITALGDASQAIAVAIGEHSQGEAALRKDLASNVEILRTQLKAISHLGESIDSTAESLRVELSPLFSKLSKDLVEAQTRSAQESRATAEKVTAGVESIRGILLSLQALASPERIREERRAVEELRKAVESLSRQAGQQQTASRAKQAHQSESEEIRRLKEENRLMRRQPERGAEGRRVPMSPSAGIPRVPQTMYSEGRWEKLLRWLGFGRAFNDHILNETYDRREPTDQRSRSEAARQPSSPKSAPSVDAPPTQPRSSSVDLQTLKQAVSRLLEEGPESWDLERLLDSLQHTMGGNDSVEIQHLVAPGDGKGRLIALWPQGSQEGLALVTAGELADDTIIRYFDVAFGRRIITCRRPARVSRSGDEITVLHKGTVESS